MNFFLLLFFGARADVHEELAHWCASAEDRFAARLGYTRDLMASMQAQAPEGKFTESFAALLSRNTRDQKLLVDTMNLCSWDQETRRKNRLAEATASAPTALTRPDAPVPAAHAPPAAPVAPATPAAPVAPTLFELTSKPAPAKKMVAQVAPPSPPPVASLEAKTKDSVVASPAAPPAGTAPPPPATPAPTTSKVAPPAKAQADPDLDLLEFMKSDEPEKPRTAGPVHAAPVLSVPAAPPPPKPAKHMSAPPAASTPSAVSAFPSGKSATLDPDQALLDVMKNDAYSVPKEKAGDAFVQTSAMTEPVDLTHVTLEDWMARRASSPVKLSPRKTEEDDDEGVAAILDQVSSLTGKHISLAGPVTPSFLQLRQVSHIATTFRLALERQGIDSRALRRLVANLQHGTDDVNVDLLKSLRKKLAHSESKEHKVVRKLTSALDLCITLDAAYKEDVKGFKAHVTSLLDAYRHEPLPLPELQSEINTLTSMDIQETSLSLDGLTKELDAARQIDAKSPTLLLQRAVSASLAEVGAW